MKGARTRTSKSKAISFTKRRLILVQLPSQTCLDEASLLLKAKISVNFPHPWKLDQCLFSHLYVLSHRPWSWINNKYSSFFPSFPLGTINNHFFLFLFCILNLQTKTMLKLVSLEEREALPKTCILSSYHPFSHVPIPPETYLSLIISISSQFIFPNQEQSGITPPSPLKFSWKRSPTGFLIIRSSGWLLVINSPNFSGYVTIQNGSIACWWGAQTAYLAAWMDNSSSATSQWVPWAN